MIKLFIGNPDTGLVMMWKKKNVHHGSIIFGRTVGSIIQAHSLLYLKRALTFSLQT